MVPYTNSVKPAASQTPTMKSRPRTSSTLQRQPPSLRYMNTSRYSSQILEEKSMTSPSSHPKYYDRPKTSLAQPRDYEKVGMWNSERSSFQGVLQSEEPAQSPHKAHTVRSSDREDDILSRITTHRIKSSSGMRDSDSFVTSTTRQRSASLLRRLSQSLSSRIGLPSPLKDSLRERWLRISKDNGTRIDTPPDDTFLSQAMLYHSLEANKEMSTFSINSSRCDSGKTFRSENSRTSLLLKDVKSKLLNSTEKENGQKNNPSQSSFAKDAGEVTHRSDSTLSLKDSNSNSNPNCGTGSANRRQVCSKRWQSAGHRVLRFNKNESPVLKNSRKEATKLPKREMTSPRIITINRMSSPTPENEGKSRPDSKGKCPGTPLSQRTTQRSSSASKSSPRPDLNDTPRTVTPSSTTNPLSQVEFRCTRAACIAATNVDAQSKVEKKPLSQVNASVLQHEQTSDKKVTKSISTSQEVSKATADLQIQSSQNVAVDLGSRHVTVSEVCGEGGTVKDAGYVCPRSGSNPQSQGGPPVQSMFLDLSKPQTICIPFNVTADSESDSSSSTPTVPLSQRVYSSGDGAGSSPHPGSSQEAAVGAEVGGWDCRSSDLQKLKELDLHGNSARPLSRSGANNRKEKVSVSYDHIQEELRPLGCGGAGGSSKQSLTLPPNGLRNHVLRTEHFLPQRSPHGPPSGQEEDPIAMGSLWSPNHQQLHTRGSSTVTTTTTTTAINSTASKTLPASVGNGNGSSVGSFISIAGSLPTRRPAPSAASTSLTLHHSSSAPAPTMGNIVKSKDKEVEPKYSDPVPGAPASFQQRLMELAALEAETVRWERSKKVKKKPLKQDKES